MLPLAQDHSQFLGNSSSQQEASVIKTNKRKKVRTDRMEVTILWSLKAEVISIPLCWLESTGMGICGACLTFTKRWLPSPNTTQNQAWWHMPVILPFQHSRGSGKTRSSKPSSATQQGMIRCCTQNKGDWQFMEAFVLLSARLFPLSGKGSQPLAYCFLGVNSSPA